MERTDYLRSLIALLVAVVLLTFYWLIPLSHAGHGLGGLALVVIPALLAPTLMYLIVDVSLVHSGSTPAQRFVDTIQRALDSQPAVEDEPSTPQMEMLSLLALVSVLTWILLTNGGPATQPAGHVEELATALAPEVCALSTIAVSLWFVLARKGLAPQQELVRAIGELLTSDVGGVAVWPTPKDVNWATLCQDATSVVAIGRTFNKFASLREGIIKDVLRRGGSIELVTMDARNVEHVRLAAYQKFGAVTQDTKKQVLDELSQGLQRIAATAIDVDARDKLHLSFTRALPNYSIYDVAGPQGRRLILYPYEAVRTEYRTRAPAFTVDLGRHPDVAVFWQHELQGLRAAATTIDSGVAVVPPSAMLDVLPGWALRKPSRLPWANLIQNAETITCAVRYAHKFALVHDDSLREFFARGGSLSLYVLDPRADGSVREAAFQKFGDISERYLEQIRGRIGDGIKRLADCAAGAAGGLTVRAVPFVLNAATYHFQGSEAMLATYLYETGAFHRHPGPGFVAKIGDGDSMVLSEYWEGELAVLNQFARTVNDPDQLR